MAAKILSEITDRWESGTFLLTALREQGGRVAAALEQAVDFPTPEDAGDAGFLTSINARADRLQVSLDGLVTADHRLFGVNARLTALREERDRRTAALGTAIVRLRRWIQAKFLRPELLALGLQSPRQRRSKPLFRQAELIRTAFASDNLDVLLGEPAFAGDADPRTVAALVERATQDLRSVLDAIYAAQRAHDEALVDKNKTAEKHDQLFVYTARSFEADCRLAGEKELAARVRPSGPRASRPEPDVDDPPPPSEVETSVPSSVTTGDATVTGGENVGHDVGIGQ